MESKFNVALERNVILEGEVKAGEQERESLRIETQRLRDELSDLKVEAEIRQDKLRHAEASAERSRLGKPTPLAATIPRPQSSISEHSPTTTSASSPTIATPPAKSISSTASDTQTPPSPPTSDKSVPPSATTPAVSTRPRRSLLASATPRPSQSSSHTSRHVRGPSAPATGGFVTPSARRTTLNRSDVSGLPNSTSLTQIRGLIGKMAKLEQRVQSARSKLPAPTSTPPRASPRPGSSLGQSYIPASVTVRSSRKRTSASSTATSSSPKHSTENSESVRPSSRLSFGIPQPTSTRDFASNTTYSRPSSRASLSSRQPISHLPSAPSATNSTSRPPSRQSISGARTPLGHYPTNAERIARPRSSVGGSYSATHGHSASVNRLSNYGLNESPEADVITPTPNRRTAARECGSTLPKPNVRRQSGSGLGLGLGRRTSSGPGIAGDMAPPERKKKLSGVGETY